MNRDSSVHLVHRLLCREILHLIQQGLNLLTYCFHRAGVDDFGWAWICYRADVYLEKVPRSRRECRQATVAEKYRGVLRHDLFRRSAEGGESGCEHRFGCYRHRPFAYYAACATRS